MRVFVTGATGALGRHLVPGLVAAGHEVTATTRTPGKVAQLRATGAEPVILDGLDREAVIAAVRAAAADVIVHQMTALAGMRSLRKVDQEFAATNELRTRGTDNLLAAAERAATRRVIAQGYAGAGPDKPSGGRLKTEEDPLDWRPIPSSARMVAAIKHVDKTVPLAAPEGIVLRYGTFYGPGASDLLLEAVRKRQVPVIGGGTGIWSFIEVTDAAAATIAAVGQGAPGVYNVVDDDPAPVAEWLPYLAQVAGAKPPLRVPAWLGRLLAGKFVVPADEPGPTGHAELADSLSMAFLVLLEALSPVERAVFMLREAFGYGYPDVARITGKTEVNCRQIFARARQRIAAGGQARGSAPSPARRAEGGELARRFFATADGGDMDALLDMLAPDVVFHADGGGKAQAIGAPLHGRERVARLLAGLFRRGRFLGTSLRLAWVNGQPGAVGYDAAGRVFTVFELEVADGVVQAIRAVVNPDKLGHIGPVSDVARLPEKE